MSNIDELVEIICKKININEVIDNCSKEFLNHLEKEIKLVKFCKDAEDFLSVYSQSLDSEIIDCLNNFHEKHREDFNSKEAQKYFINIIQNPSIYENIKNNFLDFFRNYLKDNPTNEIRKKGFEESLKEEITIDNFTFDSNNKYINILNKLSQIRFEKCIFKKNILPSYLIYNEDCELNFRKCMFEGEWKYIKSRSTLYSNCTFDTYKHYNIAEIKEVVENLLFYNCTFKKIRCEGIYFKEQVFKNNNLYKNLQFEELSFIRCEFDKKFLITYNKPEDENTFFEIKKLDLTGSIFHSKVEMKEINFSNNSIFNNTKFNELCDFYGSKFNNINCFTKTTFNDICVFTNVTFKNDVDFKYTTFGKLALFKEAIFEKRLNLEDAIIKEEINFLKIKNKNNKELDSKNIANRETARIIKDSFEKQNNIIEANKFYALEMKEREKELEEDIKKGKNIFEWLVFKIHGLASNHSQDWLLPIFWILNISILIPFFKLVCFETLKIEMTIFIITYFYLLTYLVVFSDKYRAITIIISSFLIYMVFYKLSPSINLNSMSSNLNPFSIMIESNGAENKDLDFITLIFKSTIAYLIYQLIVSIRQNTRRK
jgi:hypothetical protein